MSGPNDPREEREWADQERALREERSGLRSTASDARVSQYRLLARVLREPRGHALPPDFAAQVAAQAEAEQGAGDRIERWTERVLFAALALVAVIGVAVNVPSWLRSIFGSDARSVGAWLLAIGACLVLSLILDFAGRRAGLQPRA